jgi:hypothetical protein
MRRNVPLLRWLLTGLLLTGLFFGAVGQSLVMVEAAPMAQVVGTPCLGSTITQWTFASSSLLPSFGDGVLSYAGTNPPTFPTPTTVSANPPAVSFSGWGNASSLDTSKYLELSISTLGRNSIILSFTASRASTGPTIFELRYSTDGVTFSTFDVRAITTDELTYIFDFSSVSELTNATTATYRLYAYSASETTGAWRLDNINFTGNCLTPGDTPTPTLTPTASPVRSVIISEVAWMGTLASPTYEWIELYNPPGGPGLVDLTNWRLDSADTNGPNILIPPGTPGATIGDGQYFLLRNADVFSADVTTPSYQYSSTLLSDSGESLILKDPSGSVIDTANSNGGVWPAGTLTTAVNHGTMERWGTNADSDSQWYTSNGNWTKHDVAGNLIHGTPGGGNSATPTPTNTPTATTTFTATSTPTDTRTPTPTPTQARLKTVVITEVGWMGTSSSTTTDEWIELYNFTSAPVNLDGWRLRSYQYNTSTKDFVLNLDIALTGTISVSSGSDDPNDMSGFYLLERREQAVSDITGDLIYGGTKYLSNSGEILLLCSAYNIDSNTCNINHKGQVVDFVNATLASTGNIKPWPAGSTANYGSMERKNLISDDPTNYFTHTGVAPRYGKDANGNLIKGTPRHRNWAFTVTATPASTATATRTSTPIPIAGPILVINEFLPRPGHDWNNDGRVDVYDEFIEVMNVGTVSLNTGYYKLDTYKQNANGSVVSSAFTLPSKTLMPGEKIVYFASQTGVMLSDAGSTVRLLKSNNTVADAYTYPIVKSLDVSWCRLTDGYGSWIGRCFPTPGLPNALVGETYPPEPGGGPEVVCLLPDSTPEEFVQAECEEGGLGIWNRSYWDSLPSEGDELWIQEKRDKGLVLFE